MLVKHCPVAISKPLESIGIFHLGRPGQFRYQDCCYIFLKEVVKSSGVPIFSIHSLLKMRVPPLSLHQYLSCLKWKILYCKFSHSQDK